jgi:hypothetical protein
MAEKKKQHYVPQFYLRNFSFSGNASPIKMFNISRKKIIVEGNLKNQCYEDYFYGKDLIAENAFGMIEGRAATVINDIIVKGKIPGRYSPEHDVLLTHTLMQHARTKYSADVTDEQTDKFVKIALAHDERIDIEDLNKITITQSNPIALPLRAMAEAVPIAHDLRFKVLRNGTSIDFVTSDNPVVFRNQHLWNRKDLSNIGLASRGLQIFFPLSPRIMLVFYDDKVYKIGGKNKQEVLITDQKDVENLNDLQWLNAQYNVYFNDKIPDSEIYRGFIKCEAKRDDFKTIVEESKPEAINEEMASSVIRISKPEHRLELKLSFIKHTQIPDAKSFSGTDAIVRDPERMEALRIFQNLVKEGKYKTSEFGKFIKDLQLMSSQPRTIFD